MPTLNKVESKHIQQLSADELVGLLRVLLYSQSKIAPGIVHVPAQINVPDDGEDARWEGATVQSEFIPNKLTIYQVKAEKLTTAKCKNALLVKMPKAKKRKGVNKNRVAKRAPQLTASVKEVLKRGGNYVFFCSYAFVQKGLTERLKGVNEALRAVGKTAKADQQKFRFLDANKIAAWTNLHSAAVVFVRECCKLSNPTAGRTSRDWERDRIFKLPFHSNDVLLKQIKSLRDHLKTPGNIARITGLSGLGKTRLAFETLRVPVDKVQSQQMMLSQSTVYFDVESSPDISSIMASFESEGMSGTVVVDNCTREMHRKLEEIARRDGCQLSLLTLDYVPEHTVQGILHITLDPSMMEGVVAAILKEIPQAKSLSENQIQHIASFAHGFPQIATLMAEAGNTLDFEGLDQNGLISKILWGRDTPDDRGRKAISALALFSNVGWEEDVSKQKDFVNAVLCADLKLNARDFSQLLSGFRKRRIVQTAGKHVMVSPPPLAVGLAADWWKDATAEELQKLIPAIEESGLTKAFCERVKQLHFSENAVALAAQLCGGDGPLFNAEVLNSEVGSQLFRAMVELNPRAALNCLVGVFKDWTEDQLREISVGRRNLVWALEKLCWQKDTFLQAAEMLLRFASAENESWVNNATGIFKQLFQLYLAGTQQPAIDRLPVIEKGLQNNNPSMGRICVEALGQALQADHFSRGGGVEVRGSGLPETDWEPRLYKEIWDYWFKAFQLLADEILKNNALSSYAKETLGSQLRGILIPSLLPKIEPTFKSIAQASRGYWPEALQSLKTLLQYDRQQRTAEDIRQIERLVLEVTPHDFAHRLLSTVTAPPYEHSKEADGTFVDVSARNAESLADEVIKEQISLQPYLKELLSGEQRQAGVFGYRLGRESYAHDLIPECLDILSQLPIQSRNPTFLSGYLGGLPNRQTVTDTLQTIAADSHLIGLLVQITCRSHPRSDDLQRVINLVLEGKIGGQDLRQFAYGSVLDKLTPAELISTFDRLVEEIADSRGAVLEIISLYALHSKERWAECSTFARRLIMKPGFLAHLDGNMDGHHWQEAAGKLLEGGKDAELAVELTNQILLAKENLQFSYRMDMYARPVLGLILSSYSEVCWPTIGEDLLKKGGLGRKALFGGHGFDDKENSILWNVPENLLIKWVRKHKGAAAVLLSLMVLFTVDDQGEFHWHPLSKALLEEPHDEHTFGAIITNLHSFGSTGSRVPYIEKRIRLLQTLLDHANGSVRSLMQSLIVGFENDRIVEQKRHEEHSFGIL